MGIQRLVRRPANRMDTRLSHTEEIHQLALLLDVSPLHLDLLELIHLLRLVTSSRITPSTRKFYHLNF